MRLFIIITLSIVCAVSILSTMAQYAQEQEMRKLCNDTASPFYYNYTACKNYRTW